MNEHRELTVGELRRALADAPDEEVVSFLCDEEGARLYFKDLDARGDNPGWLVMITLGITSPLIEGGKDLEERLDVLRNKAASLAANAEAFEAAAGLVLDDLEEFKDR